MRDDPLFFRALDAVSKTGLRTRLALVGGLLLFYLGNVAACSLTMSIGMAFGYALLLAPVSGVALMLFVFVLADVVAAVFRFLAEGLEIDRQRRIESKERERVAGALSDPKTSGGELSEVKK